ncbi:uncharacterized protein [Temnothorax longispinosus]|uniref:uncharacterized protein n=1 Tax=Temnothorax longispinosus TaxID=300112 RepID=UPI003A999444
MFVALLVFALVTAHVTATLPSYLRPCGRKDPNYDQCIRNSAELLKDKICTGMPELNLPPNEPLIIDKLVVYDTANVKLHLSDVKVYGICDFVINSVHANPDKLHYDFNVNVKALRFDAMYDFNIHILLTQIAHKGILHVTSDNLGVKLGVDYKSTIKNGKTSGYTSKVNLNLNIKTFNFKFDEKEKELVNLHKIFSNIISVNQEEIIKTVKPALEEELSKRVISIFNRVFDRINFEELFPERA